jgi:hypothetical protein
MAKRVFYTLLGIGVSLAVVSVILVILMNSWSKENTITGIRVKFDNRVFNIRVKGDESLISKLVKSLNKSPELEVTAEVFDVVKHKLTVFVIKLYELQDNLTPSKIIEDLRQNTEITGVIMMTDDTKRGSALLSVVYDKMIDRFLVTDIMPITHPLTQIQIGNMTYIDLFIGNYCTPDA